MERIYAAPDAGHPKEIEQLFTAWNSHDPDGVVASFTEDIVYGTYPQDTLAVEVMKCANGLKEPLLSLKTLNSRS
jgi:hypothetical protein